MIADLFIKRPKFAIVIAILLIMAWKTAGYLGLDYLLLRWLGVPWQTRSHEPAPAPGIQLAPALE